MKEISSPLCRRDGAHWLSMGATAMVMLVLVESCGSLGGPPSAIDVAADSTGTGVVVTWTPPAEGPPDAYVLYFRPVGEVGYRPLADTTASVYVHDPDGMTGTYKVAARFGTETFQSSDTASTVPVHTAAVLVHELNTTGDAGYGWDRENGAGGVFDMREDSNAGHIDFYLSDSDTGSQMTPYAVFSPSAWDRDRGAAGVVPPASWRLNGFTNPLASEAGPLPYPSESPLVYFIFTYIDTTPFIAGCFLKSDGGNDHYALVKVTDVRPAESTAMVESWFQMEPGLRLVRH